MLTTIVAESIYFQLLENLAICRESALEMCGIKYTFECFQRLYDYDTTFFIGKQYRNYSQKSQNKKARKLPFPPKFPDFLRVKA